MPKHARPDAGRITYSPRHANRALSQQFRDHLAEHEYLVLVGRVFPEEERSVDFPVRGRRALTHFRVETRFPDRTLLRARLETGRTHQIRLHCRALGLPVIGDHVYGDGGGRRLALHATLLGFTDPHSGDTLRFRSPWPADLADLLSARELADER